MWRFFCAKLVRFSHLLVMLFLMFGWSLPWLTAWVIHAILTPLTRLHWRLNNRTCIFTTWEHLILGNEHIEEHEEGWFVKEMTEALIGWRPSTHLTRQVMFYWMWITTLISISRIALN
ncbi:MAG: hypothetical protein VYC11_03105 [Candidatus Thermoplasmatota archaeon]|nr:hypothetical protein [Candidatus Thermoplasmatota archaeon]MED5486494.1 hypothetical protein [Candidatus Thermoplasmatota archaeon]|tara:strand:- start:362 stop:715 length:354 start_codon:yes stop_codon:yes gene_type:complete